MAAVHVPMPAIHFMPPNRSYATLLYGDGAAACGVRVLGQVLSEVDPSTPLVVVAHDISSETRAILGPLHLHEQPAPPSRSARKDALWTLPFARVLFFDADHLPIPGEATTLRLGALWGMLPPAGVQGLSARAELGAITEGGQGTRWHCFNSGMMLLRPDADVAARLAAGHADGGSVRQGRGTRCKGLDQGDLNRAFNARGFPSWIRITEEHWVAANAARVSRSACAAAHATPHLAEARSAAHANSFHFFDGRGLPWASLGCRACAAQPPYRFCSVGGAQLNTTAARTSRGCPLLHVQAHAAWWAAFRRLPSEAQRLCRARMLGERGAGAGAQAAGRGASCVALR